MQNKKYQLSSRAQSHLIKIKKYTLQKYSEDQWKKYKAALISGLQTLADNPNIGMSCSDIFSGGYYFPVAKHMAYYTKETDFILIVALLGQAQLPQKHIKNLTR